MAETARHVHELPLRVYYEDTDAGGIVYHAGYLRFAERGRTEYLRDLGIEQTRLRDADGIVFTVRHCAIDFIAPARLDDLLTVSTELVQVGGATVTARQVVRREGRELVRLSVRIATVRIADGRPGRIPKPLRALLAGKVSAAAPSEAPAGAESCRETDTI